MSDRVAREIQKRKNAAIAPRLLRTRDAAAYLGMGTKKLRALVLAGKLPVVEERKGSPWLVDIHDLDAHIVASKHIFGR